MISLGHALKQRGHRVTLFNVPDVAHAAQAAGLEFKVIGADVLEAGSIGRFWQELGDLQGMAAVRHTAYLMQRFQQILFAHAPEAIREANVDVLLNDQVSTGGGSIADFVQIPFVTICNALPLNAEPSIPPYVTHWSYDPAWWASVRNVTARAMANMVGWPIAYDVFRFRKKNGLPPLRKFEDLFSPYAQISQQVAALEFPRTSLPDTFHFTGPFFNAEAREPVPFPYEQLDGRPLIYASLGTLQNRVLDIYQMIAKACVGLNAQLVISLGGGRTRDELPDLDGHPIVVNYAPQLELLSRARLTITHAGMNTTLESLSFGVPLVAIPVTNDQPGVAARIAWSGAGEFIPVDHLSVSRLRKAILQVFDDGRYLKQARRLQAAIDASGGVQRAADLCELVAEKRAPVIPDVL